MLINRRDLVTRAGALGLSSPLLASAGDAAAHGGAAPDALGAPDAVAARTADGTVAALTRQGTTWSTRGLKLSVDGDRQANGHGLTVALESGGTDVTFVIAIKLISYQIYF